MGVIINGNERKSIAEQVEENSKYKGKFIKNDLRIYKKDIPCFVRVILFQIDDSPLKILRGNGQVIDTFDCDKEGTIADYIIMEPEPGGTVIYMKVNGNSLTYYWASYGIDNLALKSVGGYVNYFMVIPLKYI